MVTYEGNQEQIRRLAAYLRHNPSALNADPASVAQACGVEVELVRQSLIRSPRDAWVEPEYTGPGFWVRFGGKITAAFDKCDRKLFRTIGISTLAVCLLIFLIGPGPGTGDGIPVRAIFAIASLTLLAIFHLILYYRRGTVRDALLGSLVTWIAAWLAASASILVANSGDSFGERVLFAFFSGLGLFALMLMYCGAASASALMGAYRVVRDEERTRRTRTRQQLIERMFEIEELLGKATQVEQEESWVRKFLAFGRANVWWLAAAAAGTFSIISEVLWKVYNLPGDLSFKPVAFILVFFIVTPLTYIAQIVLSFMGGRPVRSIFVSLLFAAITTSVGLLPFFRETKSKGMGDSILQYAAFIFIWAVAVLIGIFAGIGAQVEERSYRRKRLNLNDPQMLLGELIEIQRILNPDTSIQFVVVVDAARSSVMKANADPMQAEWTFREYQMFIARIAEANGGRIHSTAGDGAIAMFNSAEAAFNAAREIQTKITEFNQNVSRLKDPFRLRIGIHCDTVQADLSDVQFAAVIDIAAHVEGASQVGGIAVSQPVAELLVDHRFATLNEQVDGYVVSMALTPTLDPESHV